MVKKGGTIILATECSDGIGQKDLYELLKNGGSPAGVIENFHQKEFSASSRKAYMFARAMVRCQVIVVTHGILPEKIKDMMLTPSPTIGEALDLVLPKIGPRCQGSGLASGGSPHSDISVNDSGTSMAGNFFVFIASAGGKFGEGFQRPSGWKPKDNCAKFVLKITQKDWNRQNKLE